MKFLIDENLSNPRLASRLRAQGHDPVLAQDAGLLSVTDAHVLIYSIRRTPTQSLPAATKERQPMNEQRFPKGWDEQPVRITLTPPGALSKRPNQPGCRVDRDGTGR